MRLKWTFAQCGLRFYDAFSTYARFIIHTSGKMDENELYQLNWRNRRKKNEMNKKEKKHVNDMNCASIEMPTIEIEWMFGEIDKIKTEVKEKEGFNNCFPAIQSGHIFVLFFTVSRLFLSFFPSFAPACSWFCSVFHSPNSQNEKMRSNNTLLSYAVRIYSNNFSYLFIYLFMCLPNSSLVKS